MTNNTKVVAFVQARMQSTRLPGKVLADIGGHPMLWHVVRRTQQARSVDQVVVATSHETSDQAVADFCGQHAIECFRGSERDVLDRYYQAGKRYGADAVVRITGDCPLIDPQVLDGVVAVYMRGRYDYVANTLIQSYPDGLDVEVFSFSTLERVWREAVSPSDREHVTPMLRRSPEFRRYNVASGMSASARTMRWTVDDPDDLEFIRAVYSRVGGDGRSFLYADVLNLLNQEPALAAINQGTVRNEGYYKSLAAEPPIPARTLCLDRSHQLRMKGTLLIPSCSQTFSKGPTQFVQGASPVFLARGAGSHVWDVDGNEYIDYPMALGPVVLGHNYRAVTEAARRQMEDGIAFSLPHPLEIEAAELLVDVIPCAEMVRFGKNGSDVTTGAVRVARAHTARDIIACCGYHGWHDWYIGSTTRSSGVPQAVRELTVPFAYNDPAGLEQIFARHPGQVAAVIMEPIGVVEPQNGFLQRVRELTRLEGAVLIFDEIVTGFRLALGGAQEYFGVTPDLACFGKAMANGFPLSAIVGRREIMRRFDQIFFSFTFGGEALSLAAMIATIRELREKDVISVLWEQGQKIKEGYNVLAREFGVSGYTQCIGLPPRTVITFKDETGEESLLAKSLFQQECLTRGLLFTGNHAICYSHTDADVDHTLRVYRTALETLASAMRDGDVERRLKGKPVEPVFRRA